MAAHKNFDSAFKALHRRVASVNNTLPAVLANTGTRFFVENFDKEGFQDASLQKWAPPQRRIPGTKAFKYPKGSGLGRRTRKTLVKSGKLKREVNNSVREKSIRRIVWRVSGIPYARRHNEGEDMPRRHYMGASRILNRRFKDKIISAYNKAFE